MSGHAPSRHPMSVPHPDIVAQLSVLAVAESPTSVP